MSSQPENAPEKTGGLEHNANEPPKNPPRASSGQSPDPKANEKPTNEKKPLPASNPKQQLDARTKQQIRTFYGWANNFLKDSDLEVRPHDESAWRRGVELWHLLNSVSNDRKPPKLPTTRPTNQFQEINNLTICVEFMEKDLKMHLVNIGSQEILKVKHILNLPPLVKYNQKSVIFIKSTRFTHPKFTQNLILCLGPNQNHPCSALELDHLFSCTKKY